MIEEVLTRYGQLDVLVNNAAIYMDSPPLTATFDEWTKAWRDQLAVNVLGPACLAWAGIGATPLLTGLAPPHLPVVQPRRPCLRREVVQSWPCQAEAQNAESPTLLVNAFIFQYGFQRV